MTCASWLSPRGEVFAFLKSPALRKRLSARCGRDGTFSLPNVPATRALAEITGGKGVRARLTECSDNHAVHECSWV